MGKDIEKSMEKPARPSLEHSVPFFWPLAAVYAMGQAELELFRKNLKFLIEAQRVNHAPKLQLATANSVLLELHTLALRAFADPGAPGATALPTLVVAPYAGHSAHIADYHDGQSLVQTLLAARAARGFGAPREERAPRR